MDKRPGSAPGSVRGPRLTPGQLNDLAKILRLFLKKNNKHHHHHHHHHHHTVTTASNVCVSHTNVCVSHTNVSVSHTNVCVSLGPGRKASSTTSSFMLYKLSLYKLSATAAASFSSPPRSRR